MSFDEHDELTSEIYLPTTIEGLPKESEREVAGNGACPFCDCHAFIASPGDDSRCGRSRCGHKWVDHY